jgi:hypothetical protein
MIRLSARQHITWSWKILQRPVLFQQIVWLFTAGNLSAAACRGVRKDKACCCA